MEVEDESILGFSKWYDGNQLKFFAALLILLLSTIFRIQLIQFTLHVIKKATTNWIWIIDFEKLMIQPLSWTLFVLLYWAAYSLLSFISWKGSTDFFVLVLGFPLIWTTLRFFEFSIKTIVRWKGWDKQRSIDEFSRIEIVSEMFSIIKYFVVGVIFFVIYVQKIEVETANILLVIIISLEILLVLASYTWCKNIVGGFVLLSTNHIVKGADIRVLEQEGNVESIFLRYFVLRRRDKGVIYVPNGILLDSVIEVVESTRRSKIEIRVHVNHGIKNDNLRAFVQAIDLLMREEEAQEGTHELPVFTGTSGGELREMISKQQHTTLLSKRKREDQNLNIGRYWVTLEGLYKVHVTYYTEKTSFEEYIQEKSELILRLTRLMEKMNITLYVKPSNIGQEDLTDLPALPHDDHVPPPSPEVYENRNNIPRSDPGARRRR